MAGAAPDRGGLERTCSPAISTPALTASNDVAGPKSPRWTRHVQRNGRRDGNPCVRFSRYWTAVGVGDEVDPGEAVG